MRCSPARAIDPPIAMTDGFTRLTQAVSTSPMSRPAWRTAWIASRSPRLTSSTTSPPEFTSTPCSRSARAMAGPEASASRHPRLPQWHGVGAAGDAHVGHVGAAGDPHVPDVAGDALRPLQQTARDDAGADARGHLDEHEVLDVRPGDRALAERHDVHVVVDEHGHLEVLLHPTRHVETVPSGHDRRVHRPARGVLDRARHADADRHELVPIAPEVRDEREARVDHPAEHGLGPLRDVHGLAALGEHRAGEVGDRERRVRGAEVGGEHDAGGGVERELRRRASAGRRGVGHGGHEAELHELVDPRGDGRSGQSGGLRKGRASARHAVAEELEQLARTRRAERRSPADVDHSLSKAHPLGG